MRRTILFAFFLLAACGGGVRGNPPGAMNPADDLRAEAQQVLFSQEAQSLLAEFAKSSGQDALDYCVNAWVDNPGTGDGPGDYIKPNVAALRFFLSRCLGVPAPTGNLRSDGVDAFRSDSGNAFRSDNGNAFRSDSGNAFRSDSGNDG